MLHFANFALVGVSEVVTRQKLEGLVIESNGGMLVKEAIGKMLGPREGRARSKLSTLGLQVHLKQVFLRCQLLSWKITVLAPSLR